ncbi:superinfection immunity protein [Prochlorococcus sp. MIT 1300]|uniref:superinfection immunity protein n=1 Tax=Prochlorococcus sp. MIT 1300 TaxID=3096218 RepID=UPI002A757AC9|nr:superinfection immunity protein [Prochlorococcus sp. MIT 1300]
MKSIHSFLSILFGTILIFALLGSISGSAEVFIFGIVSLILLVIYFLPSLIAFSRKCPSALAITALNLFLGWTLFGWVASLVWALRNYNY